MCELFDKIFSDSMIFLTSLIAFATFAYMVFTVLMWLSMRKSINLTKQNFELTNRPFIGISEFRAHFVDNGFLNPTVKYINFGTIPAKEIILSFSFILDSKQVSHYEVILNNLFPTKGSAWIDVIKSDFSKEIISPNSIFTLGINISYNGVTKTRYSTKELYKYDNIGDSFSVIESVWD